MKGNIEIKAHAFNIFSYICVLKSLYTSLPPFSIVPQMYLRKSSFYSIKKTYQTFDKGFFSYSNTSNFVKIKTFVYQCSEILQKH